MVKGQAASSSHQRDRLHLCVRQLPGGARHPGVWPGRGRGSCKPVLWSFWVILLDLLDVRDLLDLLHDLDDWIHEYGGSTKVKRETNRLRETLTDFKRL